MDEFGEKEASLEDARTYISILSDIGYSDPSNVRLLTQAVLGGVLLGFVKIKKSEASATSTSTSSYEASGEASSAKCARMGLDNWSASANASSSSQAAASISNA